MITAFVPKPFVSRFGGELKAVAQRAGKAVEFMTPPGEPGGRLTQAACDRIDCTFIDHGIRLDDQLYAAYGEAVLASSSLQWIHLWASGVTHIPFVVPLAQKGITVTSSTGANAEPVAQTGFTGLLMLARVLDPFGVNGLADPSVIAAGSDPAQGVLWGLGAAAFYGLYLIITRRISTSASGSSAVGPFTMLRDSALGTIAVSLFLALLTGSLLPPEIWPGVGWLVLLALMSQVLGYPLINASIPHLPSVVGSVLLFVQPLMTLVAGVVIFGEVPTPGQLVGALVLFGGVLVAARK